MSSWLSNLANSVKLDSTIKKYCEDRIFVASDINVVDTAYSDIADKKVSLFFVPGDTVATEKFVGTVYDARRFYIYSFVPNEDYYDSMTAWELVDSYIKPGLLNYVTVYGENCSYVGSRIYRQGRGYFIYVYEFESLHKTASGGMKGWFSLFLYTGEKDGEAQYTLSRNNNFPFEESCGESVSVNGIDNNYMYKIYMDYSESVYRGLNQKCFAITGAYNDKPPFAGKAEALKAGKKVYEIVSWRSLPVGLKQNVIMEITCVCNV